MQIEPITVMIVFYFYLLVRWQYVKRPFFFVIGVLGLALIFLAQFFLLGITDARAMQIICRILTGIGMLAGLLGAVAACFGDKLPGFEAPIQGYQPPNKPQ